MYVLRALVLCMCVVNLIYAVNKGHEKNATGSINIEVIDQSNCTADDFDNKNGCSLICEVNSTDYVSVRWIYKFSKYSVSFDMDKHSIKEPGIMNETLPLDDYRSGYYESQFATSKANVSCSFHVVNNSMGIPIGGPCMTSQQCGTLNAMCRNDTHTCDCIGDYPIQSSDMYSPACLPVAYPEHECLLDAQCEEGQENFVCVKYLPGQIVGTCKCRPPYFLAFIDDTHSWQCIEAVPYSHSCKYDEECFYDDPNMECDDGYCDCQEDYYYSDTYAICQYDSLLDYLSMSATIGIIICIVVLICIIFALAMVYIRSSTSNYTRRYFGGRRGNSTGSDSCQIVMNPNDTLSGNMDEPPSYCEIARSETPPPPFESTLDVKSLGTEETEPVAVSNENTDHGVPQEANGEDLSGSGSSVTFQSFVNPVYDAEC